MTRAEATRKVAALLRLAGRPGTVGEAAAAAGKAAEIMAAYEITHEAALDHGTERPEPDEATESFADKPEGWLDSRGRYQMWRGLLAREIAGCHGCFTFHGHRGEGATVEIVGAPGAVEHVRYTFAWLSRAVESLVNQHGRGLGPVWRREFCEGAALEIGVRLKAARTAAADHVAADNPHALVRVQEAVARIEARAVAVKQFAYMHHRLRSGGARQTYRNESARAAGQQAARGLNLGGARGTIGGRQLRLGGGS